MPRSASSHTFAQLYPGARNLRPEAAIKEFGSWTLRELDFQIEGQNLDEFRRNFADSDDVMFPKVYWDWTTPLILTMERVAGMRVHEVTEDLSEHERERLTRRLSEIVLKMFVTDAFFHADLHPGNIFFMADGRIAMLDVGMVGRLDSDAQDRFLCYWVAITRHQRERAFHHLLKMANSTDDADLDEFGRRFNIILDQFYGASLSERSMAQTYLAILLVGGECGVTFPSAMMLQAKAVVTAEALTLVLDPSFQFTEEARPIVAREVAHRASPRRLLDRVWGGLTEFVLLGELPPGGPAPTLDLRDERQFRREVMRALAQSWANEIDGGLRRKQDNVDQYAASEYWTDHPEFHAALQTGLGLLDLFAIQIDRSLEASDPSPDRVNGISFNEGAAPVNGSLPEDGTDRYRDFLTATHGWDGNHRSFTEDTRKMTGHWGDEAREFAEPEYWSDKQILKATMTSGMTLLRLFTSQVAQATAAAQTLDAKQEEKESTT